MTLETFLGIACFILAAVCIAGYRYFSDNVKLRYKDQRIPEVRK